MKSEVEFLHIALHSYDNIQCNTMEEFDSDLNRIQTLKKLFIKFGVCGELSHRLALNHIVVLFNVFGNSAFEMLLYKLPREHYKYIFPMLDFLSRLPEGHAIEGHWDESLRKELEAL